MQRVNYVGVGKSVLNRSVFLTDKHNMGLTLGLIEADF
jgi:hypothetical protein